VGCQKQKLIPNTKLPDNEVNREVMRVAEAYRRAMERRDAGAILALVHPTYQDNSGTPEAHDDLDFTRLKELLKGRFKNATRVRYRIEYQELRFKGRTAQLDAWIDATFVYETKDLPPRWRRYADHQRFFLIKEGDTWRFTSGL
jgi:hypothetical protein